THTPRLPPQVVAGATDSRLMWTFSDPTRLLDPDRGNTGRGSTGRGSTGRTRTVERLWHSGSVQTLEVRDLSRRYGDLTVLNSVSFTLHAGQVAAVVGPNGAGKTTLLRCVVGADRTAPPAAGAGRTRAATRRGRAGMGQRAAAAGVREWHRGADSHPRPRTGRGGGRPDRRPPRLTCCGSGPHRPYRPRGRYVPGCGACAGGTAPARSGTCSATRTSWCCRSPRSR